LGGGGDDSSGGGEGGGGEGSGEGSTLFASKWTSHVWYVRPRRDLPAAVVVMTAAEVMTEVVPVVAMTAAAVMGLVSRK
jgi:hypothetical protein